jgi:dTDP-4-amino-4,6-dideoxygalactose transaminase
MMELVAAMLDVKLPRLQDASEGRRRVAARYRDLLRNTEGLDLPVEHEWATPVYHLFVVEVDDRQKVMDHLKERGVASGLHYPVPLHLQPAYSDLGYHTGAFPVAEARADRILSLPMFPELTEPEIEAVAEALTEAVQS